MWNAANKLSKEWCNAVQDLPLPAFQGQMNLMNKMPSGAKNCHVVSFGTCFSHPYHHFVVNFMFFFFLFQDMSNGASVDVSDDVTEQLDPSTSKSSTVSRKGKALKKKSLDDSAYTSATSPPNKKNCVPSTLNQLKLPYEKRYAGRPRTSKASHFDAYTKAPKSFLAKNTTEKNKSNIFFSIS